MKKILWICLVLFCAVVIQVWGQGIVSSLIQQQPQMLNASTKVATANSTVAQQVTATATPSGSNYVYITGLDMAFCQDATGVASTNVNFQFTGGISGNLNGAANTTTLPLWSMSQALTIDVCTFKTINYTVPLKSISPGTAVTLQSPASSTHTAYGINMYWYEAQ